MQKYPKSIYKLYLVTDSCLAQPKENLEIIKEAVKGKISLVQLREKNSSGKEFYFKGLEIKNFLQQYKIPLIINDRLDIAIALDADGLHIGQDDLPVEIVREIWTKLLGVSVSNVDQAIEAERLGADYLGISPVFSTPTKPDAPHPVGLDGIRKIRDAVKIPIVGIGGINKNNAKKIIKSGADGVAVISAIVAAKSPETAALEIYRELDETQ